ncbi:MAG: zinc ribbon domain-containing protein [Elusimicrobia bacterium]|jgi:RNA polymerase subunit RPABC4/transcription elongation factor Spt4|nr:zinc ribbon domain-containing protein [Dechloromonas sp.]TXH22892.1 MAG: zinc ribbon domain-containing protein [Elusimicrobiota bacterium]
MGFFEKLLRGMAGGHHGGHHGNAPGGHHGWGHGYPSNPGQPYGGVSAGGASCPKCGTIADPGARFCAQCGATLLPGTCAACNASLAPGMKFCPNCGKAQQP